MVVSAMYDLMPKILKRGELEQLNREALAVLGTPLFFVSPDLKRPHTSESRGRYYEAVTGLYIVYHDYGMRFLRSFLYFCKDKNLPEWQSHMCQHYNSICSNLRGLLCHGSVENGSHLYRSRRELGKYFPEKKETVRLDCFEALSESDCAKILQGLCVDADQFLEQLRLCIQAVSQDDALRSAWKQELIQKVLNPQKAGYGNQYFDQRIVKDLERMAQAGQTQKLYKNVVKQWLSSLEKNIWADTIPDTDYLRQTLYEALYKLYHPQESLREKQAAADILLDL